MAGDWIPVTVTYRAQSRPIDGDEWEQMIGVAANPSPLPNLLVYGRGEVRTVTPFFTPIVQGPFPLSIEVPSPTIVSAAGVVTALRRIVGGFDDVLRRSARRLARQSVQD